MPLKKPLTLNSQTKLFAILGFPIKHSFSPQMQNMWFTSENLNCLYIPFEIEPKNLKKAVESLKLLGFSGINITIPHKTEMMKYMDFTDRAAKTIGSVNTVAIKNGKLYGYNTDHSGFSADLLSKNIGLKNKNILVYGAGGVARAVIYAVINSGAKEVYISNRTSKTASSLAKLFGAKEFSQTHLHKLIPDIDVIINTSACGMKKGDLLPFKVTTVKNTAVVYDLIYNKTTPFAKFAKEYGLKYYSGEGMLINQGAHGFKIWTGIYPNTKKALKLLKKYFS